MNSWIEKHPGWEYKLWTEENLPKLINYKHFVATYKPSGKANIVRYELLYKYGGVYVDADARCLNALEEIFLENESFAGWENEQKRPGLVNNCFMGATKGNRLIKKLVDGISQLDADKLSDPNLSPTWIATGPQFLTNTIKENPDYQMTIYPSHFFSPQHFTGEKYTGTGKIYAEHVWGSTETQVGKLGMDYELLSLTAPKNFPRPKGRTSPKLKDPPIEIMERLAQLYYNKKYDIAEASCKEVLKKFRRSPALWNLFASSLHDAGKHQEAIKASSEAVKLKPDFIDGLITLGNALRGAKRSQEAIKQYEFALGLDANNTAAQLNRGSALRDIGKIDEALVAYMSATRTDPEYAPAYLNLGLALAAKSNFIAAIDNFDKALQIDGQMVQALVGKAEVYTNLEHIEQAIVSLKEARLIAPKDEQIVTLLADSYQRSGNLSEAAEAHKAGIIDNPGSIKLMVALQRLVTKLGQFDSSIELAKEILRLEPSENALMEAAYIELQRRQTSSSIAYCQKILELYPNNARAYGYLGMAYLDSADLDQSISMLDRAQELAPEWQDPMSNRCYAMNFSDQFSQKDIFNYACTFEGRFPGPVPPIVHDRNRFTKNRKIKIGYMSADFKRHSSSYFLLPLIANHDHSKFETYGYYNDFRADSSTEEHKIHLDHWRDIGDLGDLELIELIRRDGIQILVDLSGHTAGNRLTALASKPAPVQLHWHMYANTLGMSSIDYRLTDSILEPYGETDSLYKEQLYRLDDGVVCYRGPDFIKNNDKSTSEKGRSFTFGSLNSASKMTPSVISLWAEILEKTPGSTMLLASRQLESEDLQDEFRKRFSVEGISPDRLELAFAKTNGQLADLYKKIDLGLDPFPFNGITTTCETLWAGVPVLCLRGHNGVSRTSASILSYSDCQELITESKEEYLEKALYYFNNPEKLRRITNQVRTTFRNSIVCDGAVFAKNTERAYEHMWQAFTEDSIFVQPISER